VIDGILIWIHEPSKKDCIDFGCNNGKFMCTLKRKIDLIARQYVTFRVGFLTFPSCILDLLQIIVLLRGCPFFIDLENGLLAPGLFFWDNLYLNTPYIETPYAAVSGGTKESYNYHSQLQIRIECAFGISTHQWAVLTRSAIPVNIRIEKTVALVMALAKLHNYYFNAKDNNISAITARDK
jgi:hypothetical protein